MMLLCNINKKTFSKLYVECAYTSTKDSYCDNDVELLTMPCILFIGAYYPTLSEVPSIRCVDQVLVASKIKLIFYGIV